MMSSNRNRYPFTARQWEELQQQALIFKYMASGMPVPPSLLRPPFDSPSLFSQRQHYGWKCYGVGLGKKVDPEPGRCRRTDGKKWRCSKEALADSKYCERHMHRGKNRSRKPVEIHHPPSTKNLSFSSQDNTTNLLLYRNNGGGTYGLKEQVDEHPFFSSEPCAATTFSASSLHDTWQLRPLTVKQSSCSALDTDYHSLQYLHSKEAKQDQHCYVLDSHQQQPQKTVHRFFDDWPPKNRDSWLDLEDKSSTRLSISIPTSSLPDPTNAN